MNCRLTDLSVFGNSSRTVVVGLANLLASAFSDLCHRRRSVSKSSLSADRRARADSLGKAVMAPIDDSYGNGGPSKPIQRPIKMMTTDTAMTVRSIVSHRGMRFEGCSFTVRTLHPPFG